MSNANVLILAGLAGAATLLGVFLGSLYKKTKENIIFSMSFAASLMILISIFELIPAAVKKFGTIDSLVWISLGAFLIWVANQSIPHLHSVKEIKNCEKRYLARMSHLLAFGLILHDFPEGFAIPSSFNHSDSLGLLIVAAAFIHNIPEGYILTISKSKSSGCFSYYKFAAMSALATFFGAILGLQLTSFFRNFSPIFLSLAAGAMLFIAIHELLPESLKNHCVKTFSAGVLSAAAVYFFLILI